MVIQLSISDQAEAKLRERAQAAGLDVASYASQTLERAVMRSALDDVLEPLRAEFESSGMSDEQLAELLEQAKHEARAERRTRRAS